MNDLHHNNPDHEDMCLDPSLGDQLWRLDAADCDDRLRARLEHHLTFCAACRLERAVAREVAAGLRAGELRLPAPRPPRLGRIMNLTAACGVTALAAGLAMLFLLPPTAPHDGMVLRGGDGPAIERPVPDEVVRGGRPTLRWAPLEGATRYEVRVSAVDGGREWTTTTERPFATVPPEAELPVGERFRVRVEPVPAHLAPAGGLRTSFRTGGTGEWAGYRLRHGRAGGRWLGGAGLLGLLAGACGLLARRLSR